MDTIIPWRELVEAIEPFYPGRRSPPGWRRADVAQLLSWFNLSDPAAKEALYDSRVMRHFTAIDLGNEPVPDETTIRKFRHLMARHNLGDELFKLVNQYLHENGMKVHRGTIVDASIINAPSSTKNKDKQRDPDMHQTRKGNHWYFGMKAHIGVDSKTKLIRSVVATTANVHDSRVLGDLLHGAEARVWGASAYTGKRAVIAERTPGARDFTHKKGVRHRPLDARERESNRYKSRVRARVEHPFGTLKRRCGFTKVRTGA